MPILSVPVSLGEVLENSAPLREADIWGVLCQGAEAIQDLFFRGEAIQDGIANFVITLDTLLLCPNGRAQFSESSQTKNVSNFIAPEIHTGILMSEAAIEKIFVYSLGKTLQVAIDYSLKKDPSLTISRNLETLLNAMCEKNPSLRTALIHVLEACSLQSQRRTVTRTPSFSQSVARLAKTVIGTQTDLSYWSYDYYNSYNYNNSGSSSDQSRQSTLNRRSLKSRRASRRNRRRNGSGRSHKEKDRSRSRSPARSSSRSRSRSYSNAGNVENIDPKEDKATDSSSTSSQSMVKTSHSISSPKRRPSINSRPSSLHIPPSTTTSSLSQARSDASQYSFSSGSSSKHRRSPSSLFGAKTDVASHLANTPAYEKYLRLKDRQRKLQALQKNPTEDTGFWGSDNSDGFSDTRSVTSGISIMQDEADHCLPCPGAGKNVHDRDRWSFLPDLSSGYGQDMALKLGPRGSDRDSIVSSEMSFFQHDPNAMRSEIDPSPLYVAPSLKSMTEQALHHSNIHPTPYSQVPRSPSSSILSSLGDECSTVNKEYNGPEFICRGRKPLVKLNMPLSGESLKNPAHARRVIIVLLNGQKVEAMCDPSTTGKQLFQTVIAHTALHEIQSYFGLTYIHDGEHFFLDQDTKLHKMAPEGWREGGKGQAAITFILFFRIKYYGTTVLDSNHQHLLYLQLRQDILEERLECDENRALSLAAFALQVECGNYQKEMMGRNYFVPEYYFSKRILQLYGTGFIRDHTPDTHRSICGLSQDDAMAKFIRLVQELPEYGTHFHKVYKTKNENPNSLSWIGIGAHSMIIAENLKKERVIVDRQPWAMVDKLSFKGKRITVQIKPDPTVGGKSSKVYFYTNSHRKGRYLLQMSTDQHKFQLKTMSLLQTNKTLPEPPMFADIEFADLEEEEEDDEMYQLSSPISPLPTEDHKVPVHLSGSMNKPIYHHSSSKLHDSLVCVSHPDKPPHRLFSSVHSLQTLSSGPLTDCLHVQNNTKRAAQLTDSSPSLLSHLHVKYSNDNPQTQLRASLSPASPLNLSSPTINDNSSTTNITTISSTSSILDFSSCNGLNSGANFVSLKEVVLKKDNSCSIGISFVAGNIPGTEKCVINHSRQRKRTISLPAIFVKSITPGGPADLNGHVKPNDQILAVNGSTVTGLTCRDIINQIKQCPWSTPVQLLLVQRSQKMPNKQSVSTSNKPHPRLQTGPYSTNSTLPTEKSWSSSANDFVSRTLPTSRRRSSGSTLTYFNDHYIPEHHVSVPNILDALQETKATSTRFYPTILSGSLSSLQECKRPKNVSTRGIPCNLIEKQTGMKQHFQSLNSVSIPEYPEHKLTSPPNASLPTLIPCNNQCPSEFLSPPLASSTPASSPTTQRNTRSGHHRMSLTSAKRLLSKQNKQTIFREKTGSIRKQRQNEKFYECFLSKLDGSLGLNIIGGLDTKTEFGGVYVKSLRANGAAAKDGTIKADDRIIQINSINLEEVRHEEAVRILQEAPIRCLLVLGRRQCISRLVSRYPPIVICNKTVPAKDMYPKEFVKEGPEAKVKTKWKHGKINEESSLSDVSSTEDSNYIEINLTDCNEKDGKAPKRTIHNQSESRLATSEQLSPESHGVQQGTKTIPVDTRTQGAGVTAPNYVEIIHSGVPPSCEGNSEGLQVNVPLTYQKSGATKNEGISLPGSKKDPILSNGRNKDMLNKVKRNDYERWKHFGNDACLQQEPPNSAFAEEQYGSHAKNDSPQIQNTAHGSDAPNCSSGGISIKDTSTSTQNKKTLTASKKKHGEAVLLEKDLVDIQLESVSKRNPMSLLANMANGSSTQEECAPNTVSPNNKNGANLMQEYLPSNMKSNKIRKADPSAAAAEINEESLIGLRDNQQPVTNRSKMNQKPDTLNQEEQEKINKSLSSSKMEKIPQPKCLKSGPTSVIQDDPYEDPFKNLSWLWEVPLVSPPDVINQDLLKQLLQQLENCLHSNKYLEEFQVIKQESFSKASRTKVALLPENKPKNRYKENVPYDNSRVLLSGPQSYINASHIKVDILKTRSDYIACQSPLSNTVIDFWRMVWETKAPTIVMLSHEVELGRNKCFRYWPDSKDKPWNIEEKYQVGLIERHYLPGFDARLLQLSCQSSGKQHQVMQFMYKVWPFRGTPSSPVSLLQLTQAVQFCHKAAAAAKKYQTSNSKCPMIIHCANGCGRSAVFIAVHIALLHIQNNIEFDLFSLVKNLRLQRPEMVETKAEYKFCYTAIIRALYELLCPYGELVTQDTHAGQ